MNEQPQDSYAQRLLRGSIAQKSVALYASYPDLVERERMMAADMAERQRKAETIEAFQKGRPVVTMQDVCNRLGISNKTLHSKIRSGEIPKPVFFGGQNIWTANVVDQFIADVVNGSTRKPSPLGKFVEAKSTTEVVSLVSEAQSAASAESGSEVMAAAISAEAQATPTFKAPLTQRCHRPLKAFASERDAYVAGLYWAAEVYGHAPSGKILTTQFGIRNRFSPGGVYATMTEGNNTSGGNTVPVDVEAAIVHLRETKSVFARGANLVTMTSEISTYPRLLSDISTQWAKEGAAATPADPAIGAAQMEADKMISLCKVSSELDEDSIIDLGEMLTMSMAQSQAAKIDAAAFNGDGTSTYSGFVGLANALHANATYTAAAGNVSAATLDLEDFNNTAALLPSYETAENRWYMHPSVFFAAAARFIQPIMFMTLDDGRTVPTLVGYPVEFVSVMPTAATLTVSQVAAYFGDLRLGCTYGVRRALRTAISTGRWFDEDMIGVKGTSRVAIVVHERGDSTANRPIVALKTAAA